MELNQEQLAEFERDGFLVIRNFLDNRTCNIIKDIAKVHLKYAIEPIETEYEYIGIEKEVYKQSVRRLRQVYDINKTFSPAGQYL
jgi:phytanoyl-CoA hydroxylase